MKQLFKSQSGIVHTLPLLIVIAAIGLISFLLISSTLPLKGLFNSLNPKPFSKAAVYSQRIDTGSSTNYTDSMSLVWSADRPYTSGNFGFIGGALYSSTAPVTGTPNSQLYQTNIHETNFEYRFDLPNGTYQISLKFAEILASNFSTGSRVFNVAIEGNPVLSNFDVFAQAGANAALDRTFTVMVTDGQLNINFVGVTGHAMVNAIEVISGNQDFSLDLTPSQRTIGLNGSTFYTAGVKFLNGFMSDNILLNITGLPVGVTSSFIPNPLPHEADSQLNITSNGTVTPGTYPISISATANNTTHTQNGTLIVTNQPDYNMSISPTTQGVTAGGNISYQVSAQILNGFSSPITLTVGGLPSGAQATFTPNPLNPTSASTMTINTSSSTPTGTYDLTITGTNGARTRVVNAKLVVANSGVWGVNAIGNSLVQNNSVVVGPGRNDGVTRVYVGTVSSGRILEFSWNGSNWTANTDIGHGQTSGEIHNMGLGTGRNDGVNRVYGCSLSGPLYELTYSAGNWNVTSVGTPNAECTHAVVGNGRNDGVNRLYATRGSGVFEYTWNGSSWSTVIIGNVSSGRAHGIVLGRGRNGTMNTLFISSSGNGTYEAVYTNGSWSLSNMGDGGDIVNTELGPGRNDGVMRVYSGDRAGMVREFTWNGSRWVISNFPSAGEEVLHTYVLDGRGDGVQRVYADGGGGNAFEYSWNGSAWTENVLGGGAGYMYGFDVGNGRNDGKQRLYGASFDQRIYEYSFGSGGGGPTPTPTAVPTVTPTPTATPTPPPGTQVIDFNTRAIGVLNGEYPAGLINWGNNTWIVSGPFSVFNTNSMSFNGPSLSSAAFNFVTPQRVVSFEAANGGTSVSTITLSCSGNPTVSQTVPISTGTPTVINTNWTSNCTSVTLASSNGWNTNFDNFRVSNLTATPTPTPTPTATPTRTPTPTPTPTPTGAPIPGDIDGNRVVNIFDYNILVTNFGRTGSGIQGDLDNNNVVNIFDYNILITNFGRTS